MRRAPRSVLIAIAALGVYTMTTAVMSGQQGGSGGPDGPGTLALTTYTSGDVAVPIPDINATGVDVPITVSDTNPITDVDVSFRINHTFDGDLVIRLVHPDGTIIPLVTNRGGSGANFGTGGNNSSGTPTVIDDEAVAAIAAGVAPFASAFRPEAAPPGSALSLLDGKPANGTWRLRVVDTAALDVGTIGVFKLHLSTLCVCPEIQAAPPPVITAEGISPPNGGADPNETVTVNLSITNTGAVNTSNLVATLQASGGVANPGVPQNYGVVVAGAGAVTRPFTFTATGACGGFITLTLALQDGAFNLGVVTYSLMLGSPLPPASFTNATAILVPGTGTSGVASPYPSNIIVSGLVGTISKLTMRLNLLNHTFPDDFDVLLVSPGGVKMLVMSDAGGSPDAANINLTFDDAAAGPIPDAGPHITGTFQPTNFGTGDTFAVPAPAAPYLSPPVATFASAFNGINPNGTWSLYVTDDVGGDIGNLNGGWGLTISSGVTCAVAGAPSAPTGVGAAARFSKAIVSFNTPASNGGSAITGYTVVSNPAGGVDSNAGSTSLSHVVTGLTNGTSYTFRVRATNLVGNSVLSAVSNSATPPGLTDYPFVAGVTRPRAIHIIELRQRIDAQRIRFGLSGFPWTDPVISVGNTLVRAVHITEMRTALTQAYTAGGVTPLPTFTDTPLSAGVLIKLVHMAQIQAALAVIE
jgi:subtilisin-like proprotein convertase family protein